ncbi:MAG: sugar ABC transporter ATP-binding protein [Planctomycetes bacterium]|nr:sugar ABC transporter ATP-binding protein [Planctomycetota bacterium]
MPDTILEITGLNKSFWSVPVLTDVDLSIERGEVHALVGENGAGKSTLIKIICGAYQRTSGRMVFDGSEYDAATPADALARGIAVIYQETSLVPTLTVRENIFLGIEPVDGLGVCRRDVEKKRFDELCARLGYALPGDTKVRYIGPAERKLAEIAKALAHDAKLLIMDEPTDSLSGGEIDAFFKVVSDLKQRGITIIYITHYLAELFRISDRVTVLKDGCKVGTQNIAETSGEEIVAMMLGKSEPVRTDAPERAKTFGPELLRAEGLGRGGEVVDVSLSLRQGEITGLVGVIGSGKTELARLLFGADHRDAGEIHIKGNAAKRLSPRIAKAAGVGYLPEDRKTQGLLQEQTVQRNLTIANLDRITVNGVISAPADRSACTELVESLAIKIAGLGQRVKFLSGGNQQKVVFGKWMFAEPDILILDEPTRGIDVGSKRAIYKLVARLAEEGKSVLFISSEVAEVLEVSDRVLVMRKGRIAGEFSRGVGQEEVLGLMLEAENT